MVAGTLAQGVADGEDEPASPVVASRNPDWTEAATTSLCELGVVDERHTEVDEETEREPAR
jgi:hypothetical protein